VRNSQNYDILCEWGELLPIDLKNIIIFIYIYRYRATYTVWQKIERYSKA